MSEMTLRLSVPNRLSAHELAVRMVQRQQCQDSAQDLEVVQNQPELLLQTEKCTIKGANAICQAVCKLLCPEKLGDSEEQRAEVWD
jgi:hypothetical protein